MIMESHITVRYAETDQMGIVHHSNYPIWFEIGRTEFLKKLGMSNSKIESLGILVLLSHMDCDFKSPAKYEDEIVIKTKIRKMTCVRIEFDYEVLNAEGDTLLVTGSTSHAWTDKQLKPFNIEKHEPEICKLLKKTME